MKVLFSLPGKSIRLADRERMLINIDGALYNISGQAVPAEDSLQEDSSEYSNDPWESWWIEDEGLDEKLVAKSIEEVTAEIDDVYGKFGFQNRAGEFVIEPQYAFAHQFTCGLAAVNLNRTWYWTEDGRRFYENHFGYINARGETVIPFAYNEAWPFNKCGVAVVEDRRGSHLIDTAGNVIPGTEQLDFSPDYDYDNRFFEFAYPIEDDSKEVPVGIYDTKERKIILEPSIDAFFEHAEDRILVYKSTGQYGGIDFTEYYINGKGEKLYPWLIGKGFATIEEPNRSLLTVISVARYRELTGNPASCFIYNGKKYERDYLYGVYSSKGAFLIPTEYEKITEISDNLFGCVKGGIVSLVKVEDTEC